MTACEDGLAIRPIDPDDEDRLLRFHSRLSDETTYLRFFSVHPRLTHAELVRFTRVDHTDREALVAMAGDEIVGVARYDRAHGTDEAEVAFVVEDAWQGGGVGTRLFSALCDRARAEGITTLVADVLPGNARMLRLLRSSGQASLSLEDGVVRAVIPLRRSAVPTG